MKKDNQDLTKSIPSQYGCEILLEKTTILEAKNGSFPCDAYLIWYSIDSETFIDLVRGSRVRIFDMYYDNYGPGVVQKIDFGYGKISPKVWGYRSPDKKRKK